MEKSIHHNSNTGFNSVNPAQQLLDDSNPNSPFSNSGLYNNSIIIAASDQQQMNEDDNWSTNNHVNSDSFSTTAPAHPHQQHLGNLYDQIPTTTFHQVAPQEQFNYSHHRGSLPTTMMHHQNNEDPFNINNTTKMMNAAAVAAAATTTSTPYVRRYTEGSLPKYNNSTGASIATPRKQRMKDTSKESSSVDSQDEEGKRKHFLERNRQAALKCRQRKKQWLANLQHRVEFLSTDNEQLQSQATMLREEVINLKTLLLAHRDCKVAQANGATMNMIQSVGSTAVNAPAVAPFNTKNNNSNVQQAYPNNDHHSQV